MINPTRTEDFISYINSVGLTLRKEGDHLIVEGDASYLTDELRAELTRFKLEILQRLTTEEQPKNRAYKVQLENGARFTIIGAKSEGDIESICRGHGWSLAECWPINSTSGRATG